MPMSVRLGGAWRDITSAKVFASGSWRSIVGIKVYSGGAWRDVANFTAPVSGMTVATDPSISFTRTGRTSLLSQTVTATPSGGLAPYTYNWEILSQSGSAGNVSIPLPTAATTSIRCTFTSYGSVDCSLRVTVTDSLGSSGTADLSGLFSRFEPIDSGGTA